MSTGNRRAAVLQNVVHVLTALVLTLKGISKLEHAAHYWPVIVFFFASAAWILAITILHDHLHTHARMLTASVYAIECVATAIVATLYFAEGKRGLPWQWQRWDLPSRSSRTSEERGPRPDLRVVSR